ncbi:Crp/Fnr family transcriptional regulator [Pedobacter insulae]|uniref:cAMP-binding domain of CRP or a regulatory subunit of cAMP-dependent protein kinases n=1 Tax=Pedobacter insulae TaxID=414048 RepID=A0A1I2WWX1_9SPHI|nr:Crp/Fnr family transcriptional regulator [Pedobacter insulae]SFH05207.1 cAMP-binding domain of CRP or a regulatory subunit of cAMP-dependent protein kinases [Pedobacter insulae]
MKYEKLIAKLHEIPHCKKDIKDLFSEQFLCVDYLKGQTIIGPNLFNNSLYFVNNGLLRRYPLKLGLAGTSQLFIVGDFISQNGIYLKRPSLEYVECLSQVELLSINYKQLERFFRQQPEAIKILLCILEEQKLKEIENAEMMRLEPAIERYRFASALLGKFIHDLPKRILSSYLRISEKQLSRLLIAYAHGK